MEQSKRQLERPGDMKELQGIDELAKIDLSNSVQFQVSLAVPASSDVLCARTSLSAITPYQWTAYRAGDPYTDHICRHDNDTVLSGRLGCAVPQPASIFKVCRFFRSTSVTIIGSSTSG